MRLPLASLGVIAAITRSAIAFACSPPFACASTAVYPIGDRIPSNATALEMWPVASSADSLPSVGSVSLERFDGVAWQPITATVSIGPEESRYTIRPAAPFESGVMYRLNSGQSCSQGHASASFTTSAVAPVPTTLGTLHATEPMEATISGGTFVTSICTYPVTAVISEVSVDLSPDAAPWAALLFYEARVDGEPFVGIAEVPWQVQTQPRAGSTHHGRGTARLSVPCGPGHDGSIEPDGGYPFDSSGLREGDHEVSFRARVVGTDTWIETAPITVSLRCPSAADAGVGAEGADAGSRSPGCSVQERAGSPGAHVSRLWPCVLALCAMRIRRKTR